MDDIQEITCGICLDTPTFPIMMDDIVDCCCIDMKFVCVTCFDKSSKLNRCFFCRQEFKRIPKRSKRKPYVLNDNLANKLDSAHGSITCPLLCGKSILREEIHQHISECNEKEKICLKCNFFKDAEDHSDHCVKKKIQCTDCNQWINKKHYLVHTEEKCLEHFVKCNNGCNQLIQRKFIQNHECTLSKKLADIHQEIYNVEKQMYMVNEDIHVFLDIIYTIHNKSSIDFIKRKLESMCFNYGGVQDFLLDSSCGIKHKKSFIDPDILHSNPTYTEYDENAFSTPTRSYNKKRSEEKKTQNDASS